MKIVLNTYQAQLFLGVSPATNISNSILLESINVLRKASLSDRQKYWLNRLIDKLESLVKEYDKDREREFERLGIPSEEGMFGKSYNLENISDEIKESVNKFLTDRLNLEIKLDMEKIIADRNIYGLLSESNQRALNILYDFSNVEKEIESEILQEESNKKVNIEKTKTKKK